MLTFLIAFEGREVGAIGATSRYCIHSTGDDKQKAILKLYKRFEHIRIISCERV